LKAILLAIVAALCVHGVLFLFGGFFFFTEEEQRARQVVREVELFAEEAEELEPEEPQETTEPEQEPELKADEEEPPAMAELVRTAEATPELVPTDAIARLEALSLSALESALAGGGSGESFGSAGSGGLSSGGRIGGTGAAGAGMGLGDGPSDGIFDIGELDEAARPVFQAAPVYPYELRKQKLEGIVYVVFIVDAGGRVQQPKIERSPNPGFDKPALDAVKQWRFEPAVRDGEKVASKLRVPIRFSQQVG
jgi:protein TonB